MSFFANKLNANKRFEFISTAYADADKFAVVNMTGFEAISKPFSFTLTLVSNDANINFENMLANQATFRIFAPDGASSTPYHGVLAEFEQLQKSDGYVFYKAILVPRLWRLSLYQLSDVYLELSVLDIIKKVLEKIQINTEKDFQAYILNTASNPVRVREFVCQYQETYLNFISRWMEKVGMYFYFDHSGQAEKLLIGDHLGMHSAQVVKITYRPINEISTGTAADSVQDFVCRKKPVPQSITLRDFNPRTAGVDLKATPVTLQNGIGEVGLYGENFLDDIEGNHYALLRAQEILCGATVYTGQGTAVGLCSGYFVELAGHYRDSFNVQYLVTEVNHEGSQAAALLAGITTPYGDGERETMYRNTFVAIPSTTQFRAERTTVRPRVTGTMNAFIDSEGTGAYADLDEAGRYKVRLPFIIKDKDSGKGSARIRMASPYAGSNHGMHFPLLKDTEVLLTFIDGDPDQPVILGAVPNSQHLNVVNNVNPYDNNITTAGGNLFRMGDESTKQEIWLHSPALNSTIGLGDVASRDFGGTNYTNATPSVGYRVTTAGSSESLSGGSNTGVSIGRNYVNLMGDSVTTLLGSNRMTYKGIFDWSPQGEASYREDRVAIDRLDNFALANNIIRQAEDTMVISAGRIETEKAAVKKSRDTASFFAHLQLALTTALAVKDIIFVKTGKEKDDRTQIPGAGKTASSAVFGITNFAVSQLFGYFAGENQDRKRDTFHSNLVVNCAGLEFSTSDAETRESAVISVTRSEQASNEQPDPKNWSSTFGFKDKAKFIAGKIGSGAMNFLYQKPEPKPMNRMQTRLEIKNKVQDKSGDFTTITNTQNQIAMKVKAGADEHGYVCNKIHLSKEKSGIEMNEINSSILFSTYKSGVTLKLDKLGLNIEKSEGLSNPTPVTTFSVLDGSFKATVGKVNPSALKITEQRVTLRTPRSTLLLDSDEAKLTFGLSTLAVTEAGIKVDGKLIKLG